MKLFIVESPSKCGKLKKILGNEYNVVASVGHIRSIPHKGMNIDIKNNFKPTFEISSDKKKVVKEIKDMAKNADEIILATDPDREGEAISWHIYEILNQDCKKKCKRVTFDSITKQAVNKGLANKRDIDMDQVHAQQARQILDRLVGYKISPLLWFSVGSGTSAGRVQSIALKLLCKKEKEIQAFKPTDFWYLDALLQSKDGDFWARAVTTDKDNRYLDEKLSKTHLEELEKATFFVDEVNLKEKKVNPYPPFDTSTMLQAATSYFSWPVKKTTSIAQKLYEQGKVTYIRTDCFNISEEAMDEVRGYIKGKLDNTYLPSKPRVYSKKSKASSQEAHECIRPTHCEDKGKDIDNADEKKLYELIRLRFIASQINPMVLDTVSYLVGASNGVKLIAKGQSVKFDGWSKIYKYSNTKEAILPILKEKDKLDLKDIKSIKNTTQPPPRYNEASLVKKMEAEGIGRPSTYSSIMEGIQKRGYVEKIKGKSGALGVSELGMKIFDFLEDNFKDFFMDIGFTSSMEDQLSEIAEGNKGHLVLLEEIYSILQEEIKKVKKETKDKSTNEEELLQKCLICENGHVVKRHGKFGDFFTCNNYPKCKTVYNEVKDGIFEVKKKNVKKVGLKCPDCDKNGKSGDLVERKSKKDNNVFWGCSNYPKCKYTQSTGNE